MIFSDRQTNAPGPCGPGASHCLQPRLRLACPAGAVALGDEILPADSDLLAVLLADGGYAGAVGQVELLGVGIEHIDGGLAGGGLRRLLQPALTGGVVDACGLSDKSCAKRLYLPSCVSNSRFFLNVCSFKVIPFTP